VAIGSARCPLMRPMAAGLLAALVFGLSACGGSHDSATSKCNTTAVPGMDAQSVTLGLLTATEGPTAPALLPFRAGVDARLGLENSKGGVNGRTLNYKWENDDSTGTGGAASVKRLVEADHVFGIIGGSVNTADSSAYLASQGVPVAGFATDGTWRQHPNMVAFSNPVVGLPVTTYGNVIKSQGGHRVAVLFSAFATASEVLGDTLAAGIRGMNMPVEQIRVSPNAADYGQIARKLHADNVDTLLSILNPNQLVAIVSALVAAGSPRPLVISTAGYSQSALQSFGSQLEGTYFSALTRPFEAPNPALDEYRSAVAAYAPYLQDAEQTVGVMGWISADMFVQGLRRAGTCPTRSSFLTALRGISAYDADGLLARPVNLASLTPSIDQCYFLVRVAAGHFVAGQQPVACGQALGG